MVRNPVAGPARSISPTVLMSSRDNPTLQHLLLFTREVCTDSSILPVFCHCYAFLNEYDQT